MDLTLSPGELDFRDELRSWLEDHHPGPVPSTEDAIFDQARAWQRTLFDGGWAGLSWPVEYGGRGANVWLQMIFYEETARAGTPMPANFQGVYNAGPAIIAHGTDFQRDRYLRPILNADEIWCQGFSEPNAGSDLASLRTRADHREGGWVLSGQKIWTSDGHRADMAIVLARTDPGAPKHAGITYFLMDMRHPGVSLRPIMEMNGQSNFNEMFLDEVWVPDDHVLGPVNGGWRVAMTTLTNERSGAAASQLVVLRKQFAILVEEIRRRDLADDQLIRQRLASLYCEIEAMRLNVIRDFSALYAGNSTAVGSLTKWQWGELSQALTEFALDCFGLGALEWSSRWSTAFLRARAMSIEGGTTEVQKSIVAERVLGLPRSRP